MHTRMTTRSRVLLIARDKRQRSVERLHLRAKVQRARRDRIRDDPGLIPGRWRVPRWAGNLARSFVSRRSRACYMSTPYSGRVKGAPARPNFRRVSPSGKRPGPRPARHNESLRDRA